MCNENHHGVSGISTSRLETALSHANELNGILKKIYEDYGGWNIRSIEKLINTFRKEIVINGSIYYAGSIHYADSEDFSWDGDPKTLTTLRLGAYKSLSCIYIKQMPNIDKDIIDRFDIGYEDEPEWGDSITFCELTNEVAARKKPLIDPEVLAKATTLFTDLQQLLANNELSLCYDNEHSALFIGPKDIAWNVSQNPGEPGSLRDPKLRKFVTNEMINEYAEKGHIAIDVICHVHISDPDTTFVNCDLTYAV